MSQFQIADPSSVQFTVRQIAELVQGQLDGNPDALVTNPCSHCSAIHPGAVLGEGLSFGAGCIIRPASGRFGTDGHGADGGE